MKALTIKEIKDRCEKDDKVDFKGIVEKVYQFNDKKTEYRIGYQNIIIKDDTDSIKFIHTIKKSKDELYDSSIEGKKVEVSGRVSIFNEQTNIFGKLKFEEEAKELKSPVGVQSGIGQVLTAPEVTKEEIRIRCLELSQKLLKDDNPGTKDIIDAAAKFEGYVYNPKKIERAHTTTKDKTSQKEKEEEPKGKLSTEQIKKINTLMALVENRGDEGKDIITEITERQNYKSIKDFNEEDIKEASGRLEQLGSEDIPF